MVGEHADARADAEGVKQSLVFDEDLAVLLRERADAQTRFAAFNVEHATEATRGIELTGPRSFESAIAPASRTTLRRVRSRWTTEAKTVRAQS